MFSGRIGQRNVDGFSRSLILCHFLADCVDVIDLCMVRNGDVRMELRGRARSESRLVWFGQT